MSTLRRYKYLLVWPLANLRSSPWIAAASVVAMAAAAFLVATLLGFVAGYERAVERDVDRLGYDLLITAKGCPYEAATLMLRGGVGLRYMPDGVVSRLHAEAGVVATYPTMIHPVRDPGTPSGMILYQGVVREVAPALGLKLVDGEWFPEDPAPDGMVEVVMGFEAAELQQRRSGDKTLIPGPTPDQDRPARVIGVLGRTGTQVDGGVLLRLDVAQSIFGLEGQLTGVGVQVDPSVPGLADVLYQKYNEEPGLQVVSLSAVTQRLKTAMQGLRDVVGFLASILGVMAAVILVNTALLRSLGEARRLYTLVAIGLRRRFIWAAAFVENAIVVLLGAGVGLLLAQVMGPWSSLHLARYLPYEPQGNLVEVPMALVLELLGAALALGVVATLPALVQLAWFSDLETLRQD